MNIDGRGPSIWDTFSHSSNKTHAHETGDIADLSYFKITEDVELIRNLSVNAYRFSISWSRIYPLGKGEINLAGVEYYNRLINTLLHSPPSPTTAGNITLIVTLFHWDLPQALEEEYLGWLDPQIQIDFENYARTCFELFGDRVKLWITINEPWTFAVNGYDSGINAPGRCTDRIQCPEGDSSSEPYLVSHNVLNAHSRVVQIYRFVPLSGKFTLTYDQTRVSAVSRWIYWYHTKY